MQSNQLLWSRDGRDYVISVAINLALAANAKNSSLTRKEGRTKTKKKKNQLEFGEEEGIVVLNSWGQEFS